MVGTYKRETDRQSWSEDSMKQAIQAIERKDMGWLKASKIFGVPKATLRRRVMGKNKRITGADKGLGRFVPTFSKRLETLLVDHIKDLESRMFGLTCNDIRKLAFQLAEQNRIPHRFSKKEEMAGWDWLRGFRKRNPDISLRKPEPTSAARAQSFNKPQVEKFFNILEQTLQENNIEPGRVWNVDESALSTVQKPQKVFAATGKKQVGTITSAERGQHVTVVCCMSSSGNFIPPTLIFPRKRWKHELLDGAPTGSLGLPSESGWMTGDSFLTWLKHFQKYANGSKDNKVLLLLDGHSTHKGLEVVTYARENGIIMISFPPHCTHKLQPLDVCFYGPLKTYYDQSATQWLKNHPGRVITQFQVAEIFSEAYGKAATVSNALSGFRKTGIWPFNPQIFPEHEFLPSLVTNIDEEREDTSNGDVRVENIVEPTHSEEQRVQNDSITKEDVTLPYGSNESENIPDTPLPDVRETYSSETQHIRVSPQDILPVPSASGSYVRSKRKRDGSQILTSSPYLLDLKAKVAGKRALEERKAARNAKRQLKFRDDSEEEANILGEDGDEDDAPCIYCNDLFSRSKPGETWLRCVKCAMWAHSECAGLPKRTKRFLCDICKD